MNVKDIRKFTGLTRQQFSDKYHIPLNTIRNWEQGIRKCPLYVEELLEFRVKHEDLK